MTFIVGLEEHAFGHIPVPVLVRLEAVEAFGYAFGAGGKEEEVVARGGDLEGDADIGGVENGRTMFAFGDDCVAGLIAVA